MSSITKKTSIRIALFGFGMRYSHFGAGTYLRNLKAKLEQLGCVVDTLDKNPYTTHKISPIFSLLAAIRMIFTRWWKYDYIFANEGGGAFVFSPRKIAIIHHSAKEEAKRTGGSITSLIGWILQLMNIKTASAVVCISKSTWRTIHPYIGEKPSKVIWNGVNHDLFKELSGDLKKELGLDNRLTLVYAARTSPHKNLNALIEICNLLDLPINLVFLGSSLPESTYKEIEKNPKVILHNPGYVTLEQVVQYLNASDFYVNVSKMEGFGLVQVESMACGTPVIAFDTDENQLILEDGGIVVNSLAEMANRIKTFWETDQDYGRLRERALKRAMRFSWSKTAEALLQFSSASLADAN